MPSAATTIIVKSLSYVAIVGGLTLALAQGGRWLVSADPGAEHPVHTPPLPPRIAESIARRQEPLPPAPVVVAKPIVAPPVMQQATVSLHLPRVEFRNSPRSKPARRHASKPDQRLAAQPQPPAPVAAQAVVTTARSDVPY